MSRLPPPPPPPPRPHGNTNVGGSVQVMSLNATSLRDQREHQLKLLELEAKQRAARVDVPTLPNDVRRELRELRQPVRTFGETLADVRDRLRLVKARLELLRERGLLFVPDSGASAAPAPPAEEERVTKYSRAIPELIEARKAISEFSLRRAQRRLDAERGYRVQWQRKRARLAEIAAAVEGVINEEETGDESDVALIDATDDKCRACFKTIRKIGLEGSQYGDARPLSSICTSQNTKVSGLPLLATGSWSGTIKLWDGSSSELALVGQTNMAHQDRIMGITANQKLLTDGQNNETDSMMLASVSIDLTAKLWKVEKSDADMNDADDTNEDDAGKDASVAKSTPLPYFVTEVAHLQGHASRLCRAAFHPLGNYVATTSFDHTWRLWDIESGGKEILLQDGHWKEVFGIGFHPDGSMVATTDFGSVVQLWDLRTGKSIHHCLGHARRVLCAEFHPTNGFQLATSGDDGTIKVWDLRQRKQFASIPAHSGLITQLQFENDQSSDGGSSSEYLASSSFDGTAKMWSARDWNFLSTLRGHEGKVTGVGLLGSTTVVTCGFDKTLKLWR